MKLFFTTLLFASAISASSLKAQETPHDRMIPGRTIANAPLKSYPDSVAFDSLFSIYYQRLKPKIGVREQAELQFSAMSRSFAMSGIDSIQASKVAFNSLDTHAFYKLFHDAYRRNLNAKQLALLMQFSANADGEHILEVFSNLQSAPRDGNMYITRVLSANLLPLRQAARERMEKEQPPKNKDQRTPQRIPIPDMNQQNVNSTIVVGDSTLRKKK
ncbi:MAG: hypothetical protein WCH46_06225 [bacterium]